MGRRYLSADEAQRALSRGQSVECLIGPCERMGVRGIRHCSIGIDNGRFGTGQIRLAIFESVDRGYFDDEAGALDPAVEFGDPEETHSFGALAEALNYIEGRWPGASQLLVNQFMLPEEYDDRMRGSA